MFSQGVVFIPVGEGETLKRRKKKKVDGGRPLNERKWGLSISYGGKASDRLGKKPAQIQPI